MKHLILPLAAAFCTTFAASALDATDARLWLTKNTEPLVGTRGTGIKSDKGGGATFERNWQYVHFPVRVEGVAKGKDMAPHFIPAMKVHVYVLFALDGKDEYVLLDKELPYTDIPLTSKSSDGDKGSATINVGVFVSPSNAFKIAPKDGNLEKRIAAVAVEATFKGAVCTRSGGDDHSVTQSIIKNKQLATKLKAQWWRSKSSFKNTCGATLCSIAETPYAAQYESLGMPPLAAMYGGAPASSSSSSSSSSTTSSDSTSTTAPASDSDSGGPVTVTDSDSSDSSSATEEEESSSTGSKKNNRKNRGRRRSRD